MCRCRARCAGCDGMHQGSSRGEKATKKLLTVGSVERQTPVAPRHEENTACGQRCGVRAQSKPAGAQHTPNPHFTCLNFGSIDLAAILLVDSDARCFVSVLSDVSCLVYFAQFLFSRPTCMPLCNSAACLCAQFSPLWLERGLQ
jgi:hypothetical protein